MDGVLDRAPARQGLQITKQRNNVITEGAGETLGSWAWGERVPGRPVRLGVLYPGARTPESALDPRFPGCIPLCSDAGLGICIEHVQTHACNDPRDECDPHVTTYVKVLHSPEGKLARPVGTRGMTDGRK